MAWLERLRCPSCKGTLADTEDGLRCYPCQTDYPVVEGIPRLMPQRIDDRIAATIAGWQQLAWDYDASIAGTRPERLEAIDQPLLDQCQPGMSVLEVGCGTARLSEAVERRGSEYTGLDPAAILLQRGAAKDVRRLVQGLGECLPFADSEFDVIIGGYTSFRYLQPDGAYSECARVLRPGGTLAFTLWNNWSLFVRSLIEHARQRQPGWPHFRTKNCNDLVAPWREVRRLSRHGFRVESLLSTGDIPAGHRIPILRRLVGPGAYWSGQIGALFGYDVIFIAKREG